MYGIWVFLVIVGIKIISNGIYAVKPDIKIPKYRYALQRMLQTQPANHVVVIFASIFYHGQAS